MVSTMGVTVQKHYCRNKLTQVSVLNLAGCGCSTNEENERCCHNVFKTYKLTNDFLAGSSFKPEAKFIQMIAMPVFQVISHSVCIIDIPFSEEHSPPLLLQPHSLLQIFRF